MCAVQDYFRSASSTNDFSLFTLVGAVTADTNDIDNGTTESSGTITLKAKGDRNFPNYGSGKVWTQDLVDATGNQLEAGVDAITVTLLATITSTFPGAKEHNFRYGITDGTNAVWIGLHDDTGTGPDNHYGHGASGTLGNNGNAQAGQDQSRGTIVIDENGNISGATITGWNTSTMTRLLNPVLLSTSTTTLSGPLSIFLEHTRRTAHADAVEVPARFAHLLGLPVDGGDMTP